MTKYKIFCDVYFLSQDGYDYMTHEADCEVYNTYNEAKIQCDTYLRDCPYNYDFYIKKVEDGVVDYVEN